MKFPLTTTGFSYDTDDIPKLVKLGFTFQKVPGSAGTFWKDKDATGHVTLHTLEELMEFVKKHGPIIMNCQKGAFEMEIYDSYRES